MLRQLLALLLLAAVTGMAADSQKVTLPTPKDLEQLGKQRAVVEKYLGDENSRKNYKTAAGKLGLLRALIDQRIFKPAQTFELQSMGVVLGDAFVQELKMEWVIVEDSHGRDPALRVSRSSIIIYPITMISKRVENGQAVDVFNLFNGTAGQIEALKKKGV